MLSCTQFLISSVDLPPAHLTLAQPCQLSFVLALVFMARLPDLSAFSTPLTLPPPMLPVPEAVPTSVPASTLGLDRTPRMQMPALPPLPMISGGAGNGAGTGVDQLAHISRGPVELPIDPTGFQMSPKLQRDLHCTEGNDVDQLLARVVREAAKYADERKELVRDELKRRMRRSDVHGALTVIDKSKLRSRREAKVHRVKEQQFERALKDALRWLIAEKAADTAALSRFHQHHQHHHGGY